MYLDINTMTELAECPTVVGIFKGLQWDRPEDKIILLNYGIRKLTFPEPAPEGAITTGATYTEIDGETWVKSVTWITVEKAEADRIAALAIAYGAQVGQVKGLLSVFGLTMPVTADYVAGVCYAAVKADVTKTADSQLLMLIYSNLKQYISDDDIYKISEVISA